MTYQIRNIVIAAVLAVVAGLLVTFYLSGARDKAAAEGELVTAYVASKDLAAGTTGADVASALEETQITADALAPGAITAPEEVAKLVLQEPVYKGEQITTARFTTVKQQGVVGKLSGKDRALQLAGDPNQLLAGTLRDGDHVDVVATIAYRVSDRDGNGRVADTRERTASRIVLRDLTVLQAPIAPASEGGVAATQEHSVILQVTDAQAETLFYVVKNGEWTLQLRPVKNAKDSAPSVETVESVLGAGLGASDLAQLTGGNGVIR